jgi:hypothetical protein
MKHIRFRRDGMNVSRRLIAGFLFVACFVFAVGNDANALPAFARKYGLRCSACHEAWPQLNPFGQKFKDNGYQLMNDRDAPIWQHPAYWPVTFRITPNWHRESTDKVQVDTAAGTGTGQVQVTSHGFDLSGLDFHTAGTLEKNISFYLLPSSDPNASFHFEQVFARLDNIFNSPWLNVKLGKFELDNLLSEKRILTLTNISGVYQLYHFSPLGDSNSYGQIGDNQLGVEYMGHSYNDRTRVSASLLSSNDGTTQLQVGNSYSGFFAASQAFDTGRLGVQRLGFYAMLGEAPTQFLNSAGAPIPGTGFGNKSFSRYGFTGQFYLGKLDFQVVTQHGSDDKYFGTGTSPYLPFPGNQASNALPAGARNATWNGWLVEPHYVYSPQLIFIARAEGDNVSQQALPTTPSDAGNIKMYTFGYRYMPIMTSRAGFAWHNEYSWIRQTKGAPDGTDLTSSSLLLGFDFDF